MENLVRGIAIDDNPPDIAAIQGRDEFPINNSYIWFSPNYAPGEPASTYYDEIGYWVGYVWTAADRANDWNSGAGRTYP